MSAAVLYRRKPTVVEARQFVAGQFKSVAAWCGGDIIRSGGPGNKVGYLIISRAPHVGGPAVCQVGGWVIKLDDDRFDAMTDARFNELFEAVSS